MGSSRGTGRGSHQSKQRTTAPRVPTLGTLGSQAMRKNCSLSLKYLYIYTHVSLHICFYFVYIYIYCFYFVSVVLCVICFLLFYSFFPSP